MANVLGSSHRYHRCVFIAQPWPEIHVTDQERRHDFKNAMADVSISSKPFRCSAMN
jgi:predicted ATPase